MTLEQVLAARVIARTLDRDFSRLVAIERATQFLISQGFSPEYSRKVATETAELL